MPNPVSQMLYEILDTNTHTGQGLFVTRQINRGTKIVSATPLLRSSSNEYLKNYKALNPASKQVFHRLYNSVPRKPRQLRSDTIRAIWRTNAQKIGDEEAVFEIICRVNHSCCPNAICTWNSNTGQMELKALRPLKRGDEVTISYIRNELGLNVDARRRELKFWNFVCMCTRCARSRRYCITGDDKAKNC